METNVSASTRNEFLLVRSVKGQAPLWQAFWLVAVLGFLILVGYVAVVTKLLVNTSPYAVLGLIAVAGLLYIATVVVSVWRCSKNTKHDALGALAKAGVIVFVFLLVSRVIYTWNG